MTWSWRSTYGAEALEHEQAEGEQRTQRIGRDWRMASNGGSVMERNSPGGHSVVIHSREANPLLGDSLETKENPGKMLVPKAVHKAGMEGILQGTVEALHHPIGLGVIGSDKLRPAVRGQMGQDSETQNKRSKEKSERAKPWWCSCKDERGCRHSQRPAMGGVKGP